jgi:glycosyltransferase involved in cell wall biosynthesis
MGLFQACCGLSGRESPDFSVWSDSPEEMASTLGELLLDDGYAAKLGGAGRQTLEEHYTWDHIIQKLVGLYGEVLQTEVKCE